MGEPNWRGCVALLASSDVPDWTDVVQAVGSAVSAVASVALIYVALRFRDEVRLARRRPELTLLHDPAADRLDVHSGDDRSYLYLQVQNRPGQDRALRVGLELVSVTPCAGTATLPMRPPRRPFMVAEIGGADTTEVDVPPNVARHFALALHDRAAAAHEVQLAMVPRSIKTRRDVLPPGRYELTLALTASNTDATYWTTVLTFLDQAASTDQAVDPLSLTRPAPITA